MRGELVPVGARKERRVFQAWGSRVRTDSYPGPSVKTVRLTETRKHLGVANEMKHKTTWLMICRDFCCSSGIVTTLLLLGRDSCCS